MNEGICVTYTNTIDDMVAFNMYHISYSPTLRRIRLWSTWGLALIVLLISALVSLFRRDPFLLIVIASWSAIYLLVSIPWYKWTVRRRIGKLVREGQNRSFLCEHTLRLTADGLHAASEVSEGKILWSGIERIGENEEYLFIYTGAGVGIVIPKGRIEAGDVVAFTDELRRNVGPATDGSPR